jgi:hypothetical protein
MSRAFILTLPSEEIRLLIRDPIDRYAVFAKERCSKRGRTGHSFYSGVYRS